jgi:hypothetical protein
MGSWTIDLFRFYIGKIVPEGDPARYFCIQHPNYGKFNPNVRWMSDEVYKDRRRALREIDEATGKARGYSATRRKK